MHFFTRQNSLSTRQCLCPLVQPIRLDNACIHSNDSYDSTTDCLGSCLPNEMHFSTRQIHCRLDNACVHSYNPYDSTMLVSTRTTRTTRQLIAWAPVSLMRCSFPLDNILCRLDNACVHSYDLYDPTTDCLGPSLAYNNVLKSSKSP